MTTNGNIIHPHPISIPAPIAYFLLFGGIGMITFGIFRLLNIIGGKKV